jgi:hypothetical protein
MKVTKKALKENGFRRWGTITENDENLLFTPDDSKISYEECVYAWIKENGRSVTCCYIGVAGKKLEQRWKSHEKGFRGSGPGKRHAEKIRCALENGAQVGVWVRQSRQKTRFDVDVSMCWIEEKALIKKWKPSWNREWRTKEIE